MRHETKLLQLLETLGYQKPHDVDWHEFMRCKAYRLYAKFPEFQQFLDKHTAFLPLGTHATQRWFYFLNEETKPHTCICGKFIADYSDKYCSHKCSTLAPKTGAKTGPKVDVAAKAKDIRAKLPVGYKLVEFRHKQMSVFKHKCGTVFEMHVRPLLDGTGSCQCLHKKLVAHTVETLQQWHKERKTGYTVLKLLGKNARLQCKAGHKFESRKFYNRRCPKCFTNIFASNVRTDGQYREWLKENRPELTLLGTYVDGKTATRYKHTCGKVFEARPNGVARAAFRCPACAPATCGAYREFKRGKVRLKVRGKESLALDWILANTRYVLDDIVVDSEGLVPKVSYLERSKTRTRIYNPDFYIKRSNLIVEVKDCRTFGLCGDFFYLSGSELFEQNCAKAKACVDAGYKFKLMLFDRNNKLIKLPSDWYTMSRASIVKLVAKRGVI